MAGARACLPLLALAGCTAAPGGLPLAHAAAGEPQRPFAWARIGERVAVDGPAVTPLELLEDSRCPRARSHDRRAIACVWEGQVRVRARIHLGHGAVERELVAGLPIQVADGTLELAAVEPPNFADQRPAPADYRFGFRFDGGL